MLAPWLVIIFNLSHIHSLDTFFFFLPIMTTVQSGRILLILQSAIHDILTSFPNRILGRDLPLSAETAVGTAESADTVAADAAVVAADT